MGLQSLEKAASVSQNSGYASLENKTSSAVPIEDINEEEISPEPVKKKISKPNKNKKKPPPKRDPLPPPKTPAVNLDEVAIGGGGGNSSFGGYTFDENANPFGDAGPPVDQVRVECDGCGRKFNEKAMKVHKKICQKVFQTKRKVFKVVVVDEKPEVKKG